MWLSRMFWWKFLPVQTTVTIASHCSLINLSDIWLHWQELVFVLSNTIGNRIWWQDNLGLLHTRHFRLKCFFINVVTCWFWLYSFFDSCWFSHSKKDRKMSHFFLKRLRFPVSNSSVRMFIYQMEFMQLASRIKQNGNGLWNFFFFEKKN